ncbi:MAG TPA: dihydropteroate synthase [Gammaproteobacteria bacterium]
MQLDCAGKILDLSTPRVMGILNLTPDSFSDGGRFNSLDAALRHAEAMVAEGADLIDVGGVSTRPGAAAVTTAEELDRVIPVIEKLAACIPVTVSIDTSKPEVMREAVKAGAGLINDIQALQAEGALEAAADMGVPVCLMHMQGEPRTMQIEPRYMDVVTEVREFLVNRAAACVAAGIPRHRLLIDPGFGFGKTLEHNLELLRKLPVLVGTGLPVLVGLSRKSMIGRLLGGDTPVPVQERLYGSLAANVVAVRGGARILRVHDVKPTVEALRIVAALGWE